MTDTVSRLKTRSLAVRPNTTAERDIGSERNRSMMPFCMSSASPAPVKVAPKVKVMANAPPTRNSR
jgi:hypothetical protein